MWIVNSLLLTRSILFSPIAAIAPNETDYLSPRAAQAISGIQGWITLNDTVLSHPYDPTNFTIDPLYHLTYGQGPAAFPPLRQALADFFNRQFHAQPPVFQYEIVVASGVTSLIDSRTWSTCSDNESLIIPRPLYNSFPTDMRLRSGGTLLPSSFMWNNQTSLEDVFNATMIRESPQRAWNALLEIARFCGDRNIHFISDEIDANSVFSPPQGSNAPNFTSLLFLDLQGVIGPSLVHVMYDMSKDFGASGLRLAGLHSGNRNLIRAATGINLFAWPSYLTQDIWARLLQDANQTQYFLNLNRDRLSQSYAIVTSWLDQHNI
ncbi:PLP-dependent transferase [Aspergillus ellipticus CBS 707.79]|uniref:PLP-dependent transferase n=1 Tax=Aspergillus ellipticus CBS 707.79 TaxID=1448320 RepID=A0A319DNC3_9EURO|nr:PLP-dependent transferase [Aspergillus ellipticus CBS 707.79]